MNNQEFIKYTANRYGIDENTIETMVDILACSLHEIIHSGASVTIDEIGEFQTKVSQRFDHYSAAKTQIIFTPSDKLLEEVA